MLDVSEARNRVAAIVEAAVKAGADAADAICYAQESTSVTMRLGALEDLSRSEGQEIGLRVLVGQKSASVSTSDLSADAQSALIERVVAMARAAPEDPYAGLAPKERLASAPFPDLDGDDGSETDVTALRERALATEDAARAVPGITNSEGGSASHGRVRVAIATSDGFVGGHSTSGHSVSASVVAGEGAHMQRDYDWHSARYLDDLDAPETIGRNAAARAVARLDPATMKSGAMPVLFDPRIGTSLVAHFINAIAGPAIARRTSFLLGRLGDAVFSPAITLVEDPFRRRSLAARPFDGEGLPPFAGKLVDAGVITTWLLDSASARQLGMQPTGHASRGVGGPPGVTTGNLHIAPGTRSRAALMADIADGVYVTELIGHGVNGVTGDYSQGASGVRIVNGQFAGPVAGFTIAGNLKDMFADLTPADDLSFRFGTNVPTLRTDAMTVAGA